MAGEEMAGRKDRGYERCAPSCDLLLVCTCKSGMKRRRKGTKKKKPKQTNKTEFEAKVKHFGYLLKTV